MQKQRLARLTVLLLTFLLTPAMAQTQPAKEPTRVSLAVRPAMPPKPALEYRLLPRAGERVIGDAAPLYLLAAGSWPQGDQNFADRPLTDEEAKRLGVPEGLTWSGAMLEVPLDKLKGPELEKVIASVGVSYPLLELASLRSECRWSLPLREQGFATVLPHLSALRNMARVVCVRARSEVAKGDFAAAVKTLRINFALVRHLDREAVLIQHLVAVAIAKATLHVIHEAIQQPRCPNLYWALADLPNPLLDLKESLELERATVYWTLPELQKARNGQFTDKDWQTMMGRLQPLLGQPTREPEKPGLGDKLAVLGFAVMTYPAARQWLIDHGAKPEAIDELPRLAVIARYWVETYEEMYDEMVKWSRLPYWQAREGAEAVENEVPMKMAAKRSNPLLHVIPAVQRAIATVRKLDRDLAAVMTAEALRAYAAAHEGKLPAQLTDIRDTPVPFDPFTGKPLAYSVAGNVATLESLQTSLPQDGLVMTVTINP